MKSILIKVTIILSILTGGFLMLNSKSQPKDMDQYILQNTKSPFISNVSQLNNGFTTEPSEPVEKYDMEIPDSFEWVAENEHLILHVEKAFNHKYKRPAQPGEQDLADEKGEVEDSVEKMTLALAITNKKNGYVWFSYPVDRDLSNESNDKQDEIRSAITVTMRSSFTTHTTPMNKIHDYRVKSEALIPYAKISYNEIENGFRATIDYTSTISTNNPQIRFDLVVQLDGPELVIEVPRDSLEEYNPKIWDQEQGSISITDISIYPFLGATFGEENGYIVIPDGIGAIAQLDETPRSRFSFDRDVYGRDQGHARLIDTPIYGVQDVKPLQRVTLPIHGIIHDVGNNGLLVVAEEGAQGARYQYRTKGIESPFYQSYFAFVYRRSYTQYQSRATDDNILATPKVPYDLNIKQRYFFLTGQDASYVGVAKTYRGYLEDQFDFLNQTIPHEDYPTHLDLIGNEVTQGLFVERNVATTPYLDAIDLLEELKKDGYSNLDVAYRTYVMSESAYRFNVMRSLGGKKDFRELLDYMEENNLDFSYYLDYAYNYGATRDTARKMNQEQFATANLSYMYFLRYLNTAKSVEKNMKRDMPKLDEYGINGVSLENFRDMIHTTNEKRKLISIIEHMQTIEKAMQWLKKDGKTVSMNNPDAFLFPYVDKYLEMPISSSELEFADATIPLLPLIVSGKMEIYSGHLNFIENEDQSLLRLVEYGINPAYIMTTESTYTLQYTNASNIFISEYDNLKFRMEKYDTFLKEGLDAINGHELVNHEYLGPGLTRSTFANGIQIVVNYGATPVEINGLTIASNGYGVIYE